MKKTLFIFALILFSGYCNAQGTGYLKVANHGSFEKIEHLSSGGYITVGFDSVNKIQVTRWDETATPLWNFKFTDVNIVPVSPKIIEANDGNFYFMTASGEHTGSTLIIKLSTTGVILWEKIYYLTSGNMNSFALSKAAGTDNGFIFGGGQCTLTNYVIKCDASGNIEWQNQYYYPLSTGVITCWSIIPEGNNYVLSAGYNINSLLTIKIDATGNVLTHTAYTYAGMQIVPQRIVKLNSTGGYAIMGNYNSSNNNKTEFVAIFNSAFTLLSFNELTVTYTQFILMDITPINNGNNIVVNGSIYDNSVFSEAVINLSNLGSIVWKKRAEGNTGGIKNVEFRGVTQNGNYTVHAGHGYNEGSVFAVLDNNGTGLCSDMTFDITNVSRTLALQSSSITPIAGTALAASVNYTNNLSSSFVKSLYCGNLETPETESLKSDFSIYPNPSIDKAIVEFNFENSSKNAVLNLYDITGNLIYQIAIFESKGQVEINTNQLKKGIYLIGITDEYGNNTMKKLIVI